MPAAKGKRGAAAKSADSKPEPSQVEDEVLQETVDEAPLAKKAKGRGKTVVAAKPTDTKEDALSGDESESSKKNGDGDKPAAKGRSRPGAKKGKEVVPVDVSDDESESSKKNGDGEKPSTKGQGRVPAKKPVVEVADEEASKVTSKKGPKKAAAKDVKAKVEPTRRGGERAVKKPTVREVDSDEDEDKPAKKGRGAKAKNGSSVAVEAKKRGRQPKASAKTKVDEKGDGAVSDDEEVSSAEEEAVDGVAVEA